MARINFQRFLDLMAQQAEIGATPEGGLNRPALSEMDIRARQWLFERATAAGLEVAMDGAGNQRVMLRANDPDAQTLLIGSHLDSVPNGGRFDGALGVVAGLEVLLTLKDSGAELPFHVEVVNFTDEEGTLRGLLGSSAMTGTLTAEGLPNVRGGADALQEGLSRLGLSSETLLNARRDFANVMGYLEVHIEQGTRLEQAGINIGVVTSIVGVRSYWLTLTGEAAHAGTKPMADRRDALWGAAHLIQQARELVLQYFQPGVVNFGSIHAEPGAFNIVPAEVRLALEFRHGDPEKLDAMQTALFNVIRRSATEFNLEVEITPAGLIPPAPMAEPMVQLVEQAASGLGLSHTRLMSFAGHDAQSLANVTPSVMFFVPSVRGISHNPAEYSTPQDCINAAEVMLQAVLGLADR
ncbi:MAG: Zn-dependent hydrolase [Anaerolineae bacterium]|nr:Zn-dependent hydrolase [Anaerolineae bacterium]